MVCSGIAVAYALGLILLQRAGAAPAAANGRPRLLIAVAFAIPLIGLILAEAGMVRPARRRLMPVLGFVLNALTLVGLYLLLVSGVA